MMKNASIATRVFLLAAAMAALSTSALGAEGGSLAGTVVDAASQSPISDAVVTARGSTLVGVQSAVTDSNGLFEMTLLPAGTYDLTVKHDGFQTLSPGPLVLKGRQVTIRLAILRHLAPPPPPTAPLESAVEFTDSTMSAPSMISGPSPEYTEEAIEHGVEGTISLRCIVNTQGRVHGCQVQKSLPFMDRAVINALEARKYRPALSQGKPVDIFYTFTVRLKLPAQ
jgi:TonB family protein